MSFLTGKNQKVFDFMLAAQREHPQGMPPSLRTIARGCGLGSAAAAQYHAKKLVDLGMAEETGDSARKYRVLDKHAEMTALQRAARNYRPEQVFGLDVLNDWARRAGYIATAGQDNVAP
jgi:SOS-response transcriptional repressor LexA